MNFVDIVRTSKPNRLQRHRMNSWRLDLTERYIPGSDLQINSSTVEYIDAIVSDDDLFYVIQNGSELRLVNNRTEDIYRFQILHSNDGTKVKKNKVEPGSKVDED